jgi:hypothetical protein
MSKLEPEWSEKIDTDGRPRDPLGSERARNRSVRLYANALLTNNTLRLRYLSLFSWFLSELNDREQQIDAEDISKDNLIRKFEKLFALSSQYHRRDKEQDWEVIRGITGVSRLGNYDSIDAFDEVSYEDIELQKNDGYGYEEYEGVMQSFFIKRGGYELTGVGESLAEVVGKNLDEYSDELFQLVRGDVVTSADFDQYAQLLSMQSIFTHPEEFESERVALQKVLCGMLQWDGDDTEGTVKIGKQGEFEFDVLKTLFRVQRNYEADDEEVENPLESQLHENFDEGLHEFQNAFSHFVLRAWDLYQPTDRRISFTKKDNDLFDEFQTLMRVYWLQVYAGYAIEAQLEALSTFINKQHPPRYDLETILSEISDPVVAESASSALTTISLESTTEPIGGKQFTRNLILYGESYGTEVEASVAKTPTESIPTLREASDFLTTERVEAQELEELNEVLLSKSIRESLNKLDSAKPDDAFEYWQIALGRSIALLLFVVERYRHLAEDIPTLHRYMRRQLWTDPGNAVPILDDYLRQLESDITLSELGRKIVRDRVVDIHTEVMYERLTPGNLQRLISLDRDEAVCLRMDQDPGQQPFTANPRFVRFDEMNTMLRDAGCLQRIETSKYEITDQGLSFLSAAYGGEK